MSETPFHAATQRVRQRVGADLLRLLEEELSQTDLTTLLMSVASSRAAQVAPGRLLSASARDRFTIPAASDPRTMTAFEHRLWQLLPEQFVALELSPLAPLGVCSALAGVAQNRIVSTIRGSEVVSDATNVLALEAARRRQSDSAAVVHLAAGHRLVRAQHFGKDANAHFRLLSLVSSARDRGSGHVQAELLLKHLRAWAAILRDALPSSAQWHVGVTVFRPGVVAERLHDTVIPTLMPEGVDFRELPHRSGADHYTELAFKINVEADKDLIEIGDGGLTDWTARLLNNAKERCLISCIATERLATLSSV